MNFLHHHRVYVEVMHTNGWLLGFGETLGQADFFPNYGRSQPGCGIDLTGSCAHGRAPIYFAESINSFGFVAQRCGKSSDIDRGSCKVQDEKVIMRPEPPNVGLTGSFYLSTNKNWPYAKG